METWKPVRGYESLYEVSSQGEVRRVKGGQGARPGRLLQPLSDGRYLKVHLSKNNRIKQVYVHYLVAEAFLGARPDGMQINHRDGNKLNNTDTNLEYVTPLENTRHAIAKGLWDHAGERNGGAKLSAEAVAMIRHLRAGNFSPKQIARVFSIKPNTVSQIVNNKSWRDRQPTPDVKEL